jgi:twitching motility protein PilT
MKTLQQMLRELARAEVAEFAVASDRLPCVKVGETYEPVDDSTRSTDAILEMLVSAGGSRYVDELEAQPAQWTTRVDGLGSIAVTAIMRAGRVQARFTLVRRPVPPPGPAQVPARPAPPMALDSSGLPRTQSESDAPEAPGGYDGATFSDPMLRAAVVRGPALAAATAVRRPAPASDVAVRAPLGLTTDPVVRTPLALTTDPVVRAPLTPATEPVVRAPLVPASDPVVRPPLALTSDPVVRRPLSPSIEPVGRGPLPLDDLLATARQMGASDLHLVSGRPMLLRVGGELNPRGEPIDEAVVEALIMPVVPERVRAALDENGSCDFAVERVTGRFRVNVSRQRTGLKACFRCIPAGIPTLASLGLPAEIERATRHHQGLVLVTGPTGHGKTSTLAAIVDIINAGTTHHIITVEDPVEFVHMRKKAMISQREVGAHTRSFQSALKASLREDPDVIVVGELRDTETVRMALAASETGHLVIGTMNTPSAAKTIDRLIDLFPPADQPQVRMTLAGSLHLIVAQRLLPSVDGSSMVPAVELLPGSVALWSLIRDNKTYQIPSLQQRGKGFGIVRLDESLADLVRAGRVDRARALSIAEAPDELEAVLSGKRPAAAVVPSFGAFGKKGA